MLIAQISDTHIAGPGEKAYGIAPTAHTLALTVQHINQLELQPDLALVTGDITNRGREEEAEQAAKLLAELACPYYIVPGNHDDRSLLRSVFRGEVCPSSSQKFIHYVIEGHAVRLIALDSTKPGAPGGEICEERAAWLDERLSQANTQPTVLFMHHPPIPCGVLETDMDGFEGDEALGNIVEKYSNIERIICGHIHLPVHARWRGTIVSTAPSTGMQLGLDLSMELPSSFLLGSPFYQLHHWTKHNHLITHTIQVGNQDGPYPFDER